MLIEKLTKQYDLERIILEYNNIMELGLHWHSDTQLAIQHSGDGSYTASCGSLYYDFEKGEHKKVIIPERKYTYINAAFEGTIFEEIIKEHNGYRARLLIRNPMSLYSIHADYGPRIHLPIITNNSSYFVFPEHNYIEHLPADGHLYKVNAAEKHTFFNADFKLDRIHMVFCV